MDWIIVNVALAGLSSVCAILTIREKCIGHGKYLTRPMVYAWLCWKARRLSRRLPLGVYQYGIMPSLFRMGQVITLFAFLVWQGVVSVFTPMPACLPTFTYFIPLTALYADDLLTKFDKDKWRKRFHALKNKVVWKWVPAPVPIRING